MNTIATSSAALERRKAQKMSHHQSQDHLHGAQRINNKVGYQTNTNYTATRITTQVVLHQHEPKVTEVDNSSEKVLSPGNDSPDQPI